MIILLISNRSTELSAKEFKDSTPKWQSFWKSFSEEFEKKDIDFDDLEDWVDEFLHVMNLGKKFPLVEMCDKDVPGGVQYFIALERLRMQEWGYGGGTSFEMDFEKKQIMFHDKGEELKKDFPTVEEIEVLKKWRDVIHKGAIVGFVSRSEFS